MKAVKEGIEAYKRAKEIITDVVGETEEEFEVNELITELEREMEQAARNLQFEKAIVLRDQIAQLKKVIEKKA